MRKTRIFLMILVFLLLSGTAAFAAPSDFSGLTGEPSKGGLDISMKSYRLVDSTMEEIPAMVRIQAGEKTSYIPVLTNEGKTCQIRLRIFASTQNQKVNILKYCYGFEDKWEHKDGWFYYREPFRHGDRVQICKGFDFPDEWRWRECNVLDVTVEAEAVADEPIVRTPVHTPKTGDDFHLVACAALCLAALLAAFSLLWRKKYEKKDV